MTQRIYLTGFMTSGKSTLGSILANVLGWNFYDLDKEIESLEAVKVTEIFETKGEEYFRELETKILTDFSQKDKVVVALGGGALNSDRNFSIISESGKLIYLKVSPEIIYKRIRRKTDRPLFKEFVLQENSEEAFIEKIKGMLTEREKYYNRADLVFQVDNTSIGKTVDKLAKQIKRFF